MVSARPASSRATTVAALAGRHAEDDVALALIRLAVTERVRETGAKYALAQEPAPDAA